STSRASPASTSLPNTACTATECPVITGTRTQVADTLRSGRPRILRVSLRTLSSSDDQPASRSEPVHGTTLRAIGAGNGPRSSPIARRTLPGREPRLRSPVTRSIWSSSVSTPSLPAPDTAWYEASTSSVRPYSRCSGAIATIIASVVQFALAMIPLGRLRTCSGLISGTTSGTSGSMRNAPELSTATGPRAAAIGAHSADTSSGTSNIATSTPSNTSGASSRTATSWPRSETVLPADRFEATRRISPQTFLRDESSSHMTVPTAPVAPTTTKLGNSPMIGLPSGPGIDHRFDVTAEVERVVHGPHRGVQAGVAADDGHPDLRGRNHLDVDSGLRQRREELGGDPWVRPHARADQRELPDVIVEKQLLVLEGAMHPV